MRVQDVDPVPGPKLAGQKALRAVLVFATAVASLTVALSLAEVLLRLLLPVPAANLRHPYINQYVRMERPPHYSAVIEPELGLPGVDGTGHYSINGHGFRGSELEVPKPPDEFRIFAVGGSTTECYIIDDADAFPEVMEQELTPLAGRETTIQVYNAGVSGAASDDHVAMIAQRLVHLEPDLIIVFSGINDLTRSIYGIDPLHYTQPFPKPRGRSRLLELRVFSTLWSRFGGGPSERCTQEQMTSTRKKIELQAKHPEVPEAPRIDTTPYANNLRTIAGLASAHGFRLVFMTQQTTWNSTTDSATGAWQYMRYRNGKTYSETSMDSAMERFNDVMRAVAVESEVPLYDLACRIPKSLDYFYDDCHFNTQGSRTTGRELAHFLVAEGLVPLASPCLR